MRHIACDQSPSPAEARRSSALGRRSGANRKERGAQARDSAADDTSVTRRSKEPLLDDLLRDAETARYLTLRKTLKEIRLNDLALLFGQRSLHSTAHGVTEPIAPFGSDVVIVRPEAVITAPF